MNKRNLVTTVGGSAAAALILTACPTPQGQPNPVRQLAPCPREVQVITIRDGQRPYCDLLGRPTHVLNWILTIGEDRPAAEANMECLHRGGLPIGVVPGINGQPDEFHCPNIDY